jgi:hypothetical protein
MLNQQQKDTLIKASKDFIEQLTKELNLEIEPLNAFSDELVRNDIFTDCAAIIARIKHRVDQLERLVE